MNITYDYYRVFYYVARCGSFTRAAQALLSNQPNVSKAIQNLENQLGCALFARSHRGVQLTEAGERLYAHARIAFDQLSQAEQELRLDASGGVINIGASETALHGALLPVLKRFQAGHPQVGSMGRSSRSYLAFLMLMMPPQVFRWPWRALRLGMTQSKRSTPRETASMMLPGVPTPIR